LKIADIEFPDQALFLAPMEDVTDRSYRQICKTYGADMLYTEFIASEALIRNIAKSFQKLEIREEERPIGIQIYGHNIDAMVEAAKIAERYNPNLIDINFGCPVKKIAMRGAGSGMMRDIPKMVEMTKQIVEAVNLPVTVKTRLGWDEESKHIPEIAEKLQDVGIKALAVHGRTRAQLYKGDADWSLIGDIKKNPRMKIPIIGNGDIRSGEKAKLYFERYGVDAIMVGRGAIGRPQIFNEIKYYLKHGEVMPELSVSEKVKMAKLHFDKAIEVKGERRAIFEMRRHFSFYFKGLPRFKEIRLKLVTELEKDKIMGYLDYIQEVYSEDGRLRN